MTPEVAHWLNRILVGASVLTIALFFSWLLALWLPGITSIIGAGLQQLSVLRNKVRDQGRTFSKSFQSYWAERQAFFERPYGRELVRLRRAIDDIGVDQIRKLDTCSSAFQRHVEVVEVTENPGATRSVSGFDEPESALAIFWILAFLLVFSFTNFWLLQIFFLEVLPGESILTRPILLFPGHVLAFLFPFAEVAAGFMLYAFHAEQEESIVTRTFYVGAWVTLIGLAFIEAIAYGILSKKANLPTELGLDPRNILYIPVAYAFAIFGIGITFGLAGLTHALCTHMAKYRKSSLRAKNQRALERTRANFSTYATQVKEVGAALRSMEESGRRLTDTLRKEFAEAIGPTEQKDPILQHVDRHITALLEGKPGAATSNPGPAGHALLYGLLLFGWASAMVMLAYLLSPFVEVIVPSPPFAAMIAIGLPLILTIAGYSIGQISMSNRSDGAGKVEAPQTGNSALGRIGWALIVLIACLLAAIAGARSAVDGGAKVGGAILGVLWVGGLVACATRLVEALAVVPVAGYGIVCFALLFGCYLVAGVLVLIMMIMAIVRILVELLAVPGQALRGSSKRGENPQT